MSDSKPKPILYSYFRSSASWRVRIVLDYKGIDYEYRPVNLLKKEHVGETYLKLCPMGQVPTLDYGGKIITQSIAIIDFLEDLYPEVPMMPRNDPYLKAKAREIIDIINSGIQPLHNLSVIMKYDSEDAERRMEWSNYWISKGFKVLETLISQCGGKYCVGNEVTVADACLYPQVAAAQRFKIDVEQYPTIHRIYQNLGELEAFKTAHAFRQPDCPDELRLLSVA